MILLPAIRQLYLLAERPPKFRNLNQSYVFLNYFISLLLMLIIRGVIASVILKQKMHIKLKQYVVNKSLYQYPILAAIHCVASGLLYYGYPYITVFVAIISLLVYCVRKNVLTIFSIANKDHMLFICCHLLAMLYTLSSIALLEGDSK